MQPVGYRKLCAAMADGGQAVTERKFDSPLEKWRPVNVEECFCDIRVAVALDWRRDGAIEGRGEGLRGRYQGAMRGDSAGGRPHPSLREGSLQGSLAALSGYSRQGRGVAEGVRRRRQAILRRRQARRRQDSGVPGAAYRRPRRSVQGRDGAG